MKRIISAVLIVMLLISISGTAFGEQTAFDDAFVYREPAAAREGELVEDDAADPYTASESPYRDSGDKTPFLSLSIEKYDDTKYASSSGTGTTVGVLENTEWRLQAKFFEYDKNGNAQVRDVTNACTWGCTESSAMSIDSDKVLHVYLDNGMSHTVAASYSNITASGIKNYSAKFLIRIDHVEITGDTNAMKCLTLDYLVSNQWSALSKHEGSRISSFVYSLNNLPRLSGAVYRNSATANHLIAEAAGNVSVVRCVTTGGVITGVVFDEGNERYLVLRSQSQKTAGNNYYEYNQSGEEVYRAVAGSGNNITVVGHCTAGTVANYLSYKYGCRCVTFNSESQMFNVYLNHFSNFCKYFNTGNRINYILNDQAYTQMRYRRDPYYLVNRQTTYSDALLSPMVWYSPHSETARVDVSGSKQRNDYQKLDDNTSQRSIYLGSESSDSKRFSEYDTFAMFGGGGSDSLNLYSSTAGNVAQAVDFVGGALYTLSDSQLLDLLNKNVAGFVSGLKVGTEIATGHGWLATEDLASALLSIAGENGIAFTVAAPGLLYSNGMVLANGLIDYANIIAGGKGNDTLIGSGKTDWYVYVKGDGHDTIFDGNSSNTDGVLLIDCDDAYLSYDFDDENKVLLIRVDGSDAISYHIQEGGSVCVYSGDSLVSDTRRLRCVASQQGIDTQGSFQNIFLRRMRAIAEAIYEVYCPVDMLVYAPDGTLVQELRDGQECSRSTDYGSFSVTYVDGEYVKTAVLCEKGYTVKIRGIDNGTMKYTAAILNPTGEYYDYAVIDNIPVSDGAVFLASEQLSDQILSVDINGDGIMDGTVCYNTTVTLSDSSIRLGYSDKKQLTAEIVSNSPVKDVMWFTMDSDIVTVDENGLICAVGIGETQVGAIASDGSGAYAFCTVTVLEDRISVSKINIQGIKSTYTYTGKQIEVSAELSYHGTPLVRDVDYSIGISEDVGPGSTTITITGLGVFTGERTFVAEIVMPAPPTVDQKVKQIADECRSLGFDNEYDIAVWLHDWLIYNANYDHTYTYYDSDGVLLYGTGVCQSYTNAYRRLLNEMGIENRPVASAEMNHAWNLVKIDGEWCHIDCTWDDPGVGGAECHTYFGMNDALLGRDHTWNRNSYTVSTSLQNYYPIRNGELVFSDTSELDALLVPLFTAKEESFTILYIGTDPDVTAQSAFEEWYGNNNWKYGIRSFASTYGNYDCTVSEIEYTDPWPEPINKLNPTVDAPAFSMNSPDGNYSLERYEGNGIVLIFGREGCLNTRGLLQRLHAELDALHSNGIEVIISVENAQSYGDIQPVKKDYPNFNYCYEQDGLVWDYLDAVDYDYAAHGNSFTYPCVFIINGEGKIIYYSTGYVSNLNELVSEAFSTSNHYPLPVPGENEYIHAETGNANIAEIRDGNVKRALDLACNNSQGVFFLTDSSLYYYDSLMMGSWEENYSLLESMGFSFVACFRDNDYEARQNYPHITFVEYDSSDPFFWDLLHTLNWDPTKPAYYQSSYFIEHDGHIADYRNGDVLSVMDKIAVMARDMSYDMVFPIQLWAIEEEAFLGNGFGSVDLSNSGVTSIGNMAFANCPNLRFVRLPESLTYIDPYAFLYSDNVVFVCRGSSYAASFADTNGITLICP